MGFLGARYEAARHIVPDRASHAPLALLSISICPILFLSDRLIDSMLLVVRSIGSCAVKLQAVSESSGSCAHCTCWHKTAYIRLHQSVQECLKSRLLFWQSDGAGTCGMCSAVTCYLVMSGVTTPYVSICCNMLQLWAGSSTDRVLALIDCGF